MLGALNTQSSRLAVVSRGFRVPRAGTERPTRVLRVIARMNVGGPAYHVSILAGGLDSARFKTQLLAGAIGPGEASSADLVPRYGADLHLVPGLGPELHPVGDLRALVHLVLAMRRFRPDIVHTHTAKAGALGRAAALIGRHRPIIVHTYHGHVLTGYFGPLTSEIYRRVERWLARRSDCLIGVSEATVAELVGLGVAPPVKFRTIPVGLDLEPFLEHRPSERAAIRAELAVEEGTTLALFVGRLVAIKRVDVLIDAVAHARELGADLRVAVAGDGELRPELEARASARGLGDSVAFLGYRDDVPALVAAGDLAVLSSDNEGTPVALIEAAAGARPAAATNVGGVADIVTPETGLVVPAQDPIALGGALAKLASEPALRIALGESARAHVIGRYGAERLIADIGALYEELLQERQRAPRRVGRSGAFA
jgi:glycosyltransferase involved in cell wall biosynthesis